MAAGSDEVKKIESSKGGNSYPQMGPNDGPQIPPALLAQRNRESYTQDQRLQNLSSNIGQAISDIDTLVNGYSLDQGIAGLARDVRFEYEPRSEPLSRRQQQINSELTASLRDFNKRLNFH